jgi:hypothetical protein
MVEKIQTITSEAMKESITLMIISNGNCTITISRNFLYSIDNMIYVLPR